MKNGVLSMKIKGLKNFRDLGGKTPVMRSVPQEEAIDKLLELIEKEKE
jgi:hypothetical protein